MHILPEAVTVHPATAHKRPSSCPAGVWSAAATYPGLSALQRTS
jgi:hypothetical protein